MKDIKDSLKNGKIVLLSYIWKSKSYSGKHFMLIIKETDKCYYTVNEFGSGKVLRRTSKRTMNKQLRRTDIDFIPKAWIINKH